MTRYTNILCSSRPTVAPVSHNAITSSAQPPPPPRTRRLLTAVPHSSAENSTPRLPPGQLTASNNGECTSWQRPRSVQQPRSRDQWPPRAAITGARDVTTQQKRPQQIGPVYFVSGDPCVRSHAEFANRTLSFPSQNLPLFRKSFPSQTRFRPQD